MTSNPPATTSSRLLRTSLSCAAALLAATCPSTAQTGPFPDAAGYPGSSAIPKSSPAFVNWAVNHVLYQPGSGVDTSWRQPSLAYGPPGNDVFHILCLGNGGAVTILFPRPIRDGNGPDFAVFENAFDDYFLELAFVEVSSDGVHFHRFPTTSLWQTPIGGFGDGSYDPTQIDGFAGKYRLGFGTPFDLASLPAAATLDKQNIRFVRLIDIIGNGTTRDSGGRPIYDPTPTIGSGGFDLDAIGVIHENPSAPRLLAYGPTPAGFLLRWESNPGTTYRIQQSSNLADWSAAAVASVTAPLTSTVTEVVLPLPPARQCFWRIAAP